MTDVHSFEVSVERCEGFVFRVQFDNPQHAELTLDEPSPLGSDTGPNAVRILAAAIGNCLAASFLFCAQRSRVQLTKVGASVSVDVIRKDSKRLRVGKVRVNLRIEGPEGIEGALARCQKIFEDYCVVTQSVREGIDVETHVEVLVPEAASGKAQGPS